MNYFSLAVDLARAEGAATIQAAATKSIALKSIRNRGTTCGCSSYKFPHRTGSGQCPGVAERSRFEGSVTAAYSDCAEFERNEARSLHLVAW